MLGILKCLSCACGDEEVEKTPSEKDLQKDLRFGELRKEIDKVEEKFGNPTTDKKDLEDLLGRYHSIAQQCQVLINYYTEMGRSQLGLVNILRAMKEIFQARQASLATYYHKIGPGSDIKEYPAFPKFRSEFLKLLGKADKTVVSLFEEKGVVPEGLNGGGVSGLPVLGASPVPVLRSVSRDFDCLQQGLKAPPPSRSVGVVDELTPLQMGAHLSGRVPPAPPPSRSVEVVDELTPPDDSLPGRPQPSLSRK